METASIVIAWCLEKVSLCRGISVQHPDIHACRGRLHNSYRSNHHTLNADPSIFGLGAGADPWGSRPEPDIVASVIVIETHGLLFNGDDRFGQGRTSAVPLLLPLSPITTLFPCPSFARVQPSLQRPSTPFPHIRDIAISGPTFSQREKGVGDHTAHGVIEIGLPSGAQKGTRVSLE